MADRASRDVNRITGLLAASTTDGVTMVALEADPTTHRLLVDIVDTSLTKTPQTVTGTISATTTIVSAVATKRIKVIAYLLITNSTAAVTATFDDGAGGAGMWTVPLQALAGTYFGSNLAIGAPSFLFGTTAGNLLELKLSTGQSVTYSVAYYADDAT